MTTKTIKIAVLATFISIAGYWYWSPFLAVKQMRSAAEKQDAMSALTTPSFAKALEDNFQPV